MVEKGAKTISEFEAADWHARVDWSGSNCASDSIITDSGQCKGPYLPDFRVELGQLGRILSFPHIATRLELGQEGLARLASLGCHAPGIGHV